MAKSKPNRRGAVPPPKCKAILLCDGSIIEAGTGKISLIGIFDAFMLAQVPGHVRPFTIYLHLTDGVAEHEYEITVEVHDLRDGNVIARATGQKMRWMNKLDRKNLLIPVPPLPIQHVGTYDLVVLANKQEIDRQKFGVATPPTPEGQQEEKGHG